MLLQVENAGYLLLDDAMPANAGKSHWLIVLGTSACLLAFGLTIFKKSQIIIYK